MKTNLKSNFRRNVSAALILTPAALLAACSTSEGWKSTRNDGTNSRTTGASSGSRSDGYYSSTDRTHTTADGRSVTTRYYSNDPYGDGVSGGPGTNAAMTTDGRAVSYDTRTNERNNSNWRDGPTRFDNENPSQDSSSSQYNTGISRNQDPAEGTLNNQNLAKGTVQPQNSQGWYDNRGTRIDNTDTRWQNEQRMNQQNQQSNPNWQANNQQWNSQQQNAQQGNQQWDSRQQAARNEGSSSTNPSNSNAQYGQQNWQSGDQSGQQNQNWANRNQNSTGMNQGSNQNWNQSNQQLPPRDAQGNQQQNWQSGQQNQTGSNRDQNWNQGNQNTNPNWNNNQASNSNWNQNTPNSGQNSNQGWNQNNQQRDAQGNWIQRNLDTTNMTTADQQAAARQMSDPATNPTNSNAQFNQANSGQYPTNQSNTDYSNRTYPVQNTNQNPNQDPNRNYANQTTPNSSPNNGVERVGPQNNWGTDGANTDNTNVSSGSQANRTNSNWQDSSRQTAAQQNANPATNPSNSNVQTGQQNAASVNQANQPYSSRSTDVNAAGQPQVFASSATADQRILSLLHFKNQKEIELGRLAATNGSSAAVKDYGNMLVREHTAADARVMAVASQTGTTLMSDAETQNMIRAEKAAMGKDGTADKNADRTTEDRAKMADGTKEMKDPIEELRGLKGAEFDRVFAQNMVKGHQKLIAAIQKAQPQVKNEQTRQLLNEMIPTLQMHERTARQLPGYSETANAR